LKKKTMNQKKLLLLRNPFLNHQKLQLLEVLNKLTKSMLEVYLMMLKKMTLKNSLLNVVKSEVLIS